MNTIKIAKANLNNLDSLASFLNKLFDESHHDLYRRGHVTLEDLREELESFEKDPKRLYLIATDSENIVGMLSFQPHPHPQRAHAGELGMAVDQNFRGRGIGRSLLQGLIDWVESNQPVERIELQVFSTNTHAISLYKDMKFIQEGVQHGTIKRDQEIIDLVTMARIF